MVLINLCNPQDTQSSTSSQSGVLYMSVCVITLIYTPPLPLPPPHTCQLLEVFSVDVVHIITVGTQPGCLDAVTLHVVFLCLSQSLGRLFATSDGKGDGDDVGGHHHNDSERQTQSFHMSDLVT